MIDAISARAPGKVVLSGEYAVLDGAPAVAMAVGRYAQVTIEPRPGDWSVLQTTGPRDDAGLSFSDRRFRLISSGIEWKSQRHDDPAGAIDAVFSAAGYPLSRPATYTLDSSEFFDSDSGRKTGLGSSAAIVVALLAAIAASDDEQALTGPAQEAHRTLQRGAGSGVDVAASLRGGLLGYRLAGRVAESLRWPANLHYRLVFSGHSASTRQKLRQLESTGESESRVRLADASVEMHSAWRAGEAHQIIEGYDKYIARLREFSDSHDLGIFEGGHEAIAAMASRSGIVYKPCGAGGGDVGIALATSDNDLDKFSGQLRQPFRCLDYARSEAGVSIVSRETRR